MSDTAPPIRFDDGEAYEQMMGRWSALVGPPFLAWLALPPGLDWLDAGCGNGAFTERIVASQRPASVLGVDPSAAQIAYARQRAGTPGVRWVEGDAMALPAADASVDAAVMALVLFFLSDAALGVREMVRTVRPGGTVAAYHWDLSGGGFPLDAAIKALEAQGIAPSLPPSSWASEIDASRRLWQQAGLVDVQTTQFAVQRRFDDFDDFWRTAQVSPRARATFGALSADAAARVREHARQALNADSGPLLVHARANAVKGRKPG